MTRDTDNQPYLLSRSAIRPVQTVFRGRATAVYRCFDANRRLLYVGMEEAVS